MRKKYTFLIIFISAALWGGYINVWGQLGLLAPEFQSDETPPRIDLRAYGDMDGGILNGSGDQCVGTHSVNSMFTVENNYGPGESGTLSPRNNTGSANTGFWGASTVQGFNMGNGRITVGNTQNHVRHLVVNGSPSNGLVGQGTSTGLITATQNLAVTSSCDFPSTQNGQYLDGTSTTWITAGSHSVTASWGPAVVTVNNPQVPDGTGLAQTAVTFTAPTVINIDGNTGNLTNSNVPWLLQQFYFMDNPWYHYTTTFTYHLETHVVSFDYRLPTFTCTGTAGSTSTNWNGGWTTGTASNSGTHLEVRWSSSSGTRGGWVDGEIILLAGSHIRLQGSDAPAKSIAAAATHTNSAATLRLPSGFYTLMNDADFDAASIVSNGAIDNIGTGTGVGVGTSLGLNAVMGIQTQFIPAGITMKTNTGGGTILIGANTNQASQNAMLVQSVTSNPGSAGGKTFAKSAEPRGLTTYFGYDLPIHGSANLGNYGNNAVTLLNTGMFGTASPAVGAGLMQIYDHTCNPLTFASGPWAFTLSTGHLLIEGSQNVNFNFPQTFTGGTTANLTINGGQVNFNANHTYTASATTGDYGVYGYKQNYIAPSITTCYAPVPAAGDYFYAGVAPNNIVGSTGYFCGTGDIFVDAGAIVSVTNTAVTGETRWQAANDITTNADVTFAHTGSGATVWQAGRDITVNDASKTVSFTQEGTGSTSWNADRDITTNTTILFENITVGTGTTEWTARQDITTNNPVEFNRSSTTGTTAWTAYRNITTNHTIDFTNTGADNATSWFAGNNIATNDDVNFVNTGNDGPTSWQAENSITTTGGNGVTFTHDGNASGTTTWEAVNGSITTHNPIYFDHNAAAIGDDITWEAGNNIVTNHSVLFDYLTDNQIKWWARNGMIQTNSPVEINRLNTGTNGSTYLQAGDGTFHLDFNYAYCSTAEIVSNNIDIRSDFNYTETAGAGAGSIVTLYAENDILTNASCEDYASNHPLLGPAPVTFTVDPASQTTTLWEAERNINTKGRVDFLYADATGMGDLTWLSRGGYIQTERPVNILYSSDNTISFKAENNVNALPSAAQVETNADVTGRRGNIHTFDSLTILRDNANAGLTEIIAENHIWTAMVDYEDQNSTGNSMEIISHYGDIYLGHNDGTTVNEAYPYYLSSATALTPSFQLTQQSPSFLCNFPAANPVSYDLNNFNYTVNAGNTDGHLFIKAGYWNQDETDIPAGGGNIYFTHKNIDLPVSSAHDMEVSIPFTNWYICGNPTYGTRDYYEKAGIIGGVARCALNSPNPTGGNTLCDLVGLEYSGYDGNLLFNAGKRGNIIINNGANLNFNDGAGNAQFLTQEGDVDMRYEFNAERMQGSLLFYANSLLPDKLRFDPCDCLEKMNNIYLQDFQYTPVSQGVGNSGSVFIGADNNIKLQYGGLKTIDTQFDPFINGASYPCVNGDYHCDSDTTVNKARNLVLDFSDTNSGGFAAVASDLIDVYKKTYFYGGTGSGMGAVPGFGSLHGENVAGYGLYIKSQGNKKNWLNNPFNAFDNECTPKCPGGCDDAFLHQVARVTFHDDARILAENSKVYIGSPVLDVYGVLELNSFSNTGNKASLHIQTDSLIVHDSLILNGSKLNLTTWSRLERNMPVIKLGHQRFTPPQADDCVDCYSHVQGGNKVDHTAVDTLAVAFLNGASVKRLHTLVADHTVLTFLTDYMDAPFQPPYIDAKFFVDTFKVRNQVEFWNAGDGKRDGHFELVSEIQMSTKSQAGVFARHLHMEPIAPDCSSSDYSELWLPGRTLNVISTSTFGGFGTVHNDVYVEIQARLAPGYASLGVKGNCYEQKAGTLRMQNLSMDYGAELHYSIGNEFGFEGEEADCIEVDHLLLRGDINVYVEKRCGQFYTPGCYPIIRYNTVEDMSNLRNLKLMTLRIDGTPLRLDISEEGVVYLCVGETARPMVQRAVILPEPPPGVHMFPNPGVHYVPWGDHFTFTLDFEGREILEVTSSRFDFVGASEILISTVRATGEHEYTLPYVKTQPVYIYIGPNLRGDGVLNESVDKAAVWSSGNMLYIRVSREDIASVYSVAGTLVTRIDVPEGGITLPLARGAYIVTLKDGSVHKVIIR